MALRETRALDEPRRRKLPSRVRRHRLGHLGAAHRSDALADALHLGLPDDRVGEERPGRPRVVVGVVEHHALAAAQRQHGLAHIGDGPPRFSGRALLRPNAQALRQLAVAQRRGLPVDGEPEPNGQDDGAGGELQVREAVRQLERFGRHPLVGAGAAVVEAHALQRRRHLRPVRADVLHRGRARRARDAGQALEPAESGGDGHLHDVVPHGAGLGLDDRAVDVEPAARGAQHDVVGLDDHGHQIAGVVGDDEVGSAADDEQRHARAIELADDFDDRVDGRAAHGGGRFPAEAEGRQVAERHVVVDFGPGNTGDSRQG